MARAVITLYGKVERERAHKWVDQAPPLTRVEFREVKRSLPQNSLLWSLLGEIARQKKHCGETLKPEVWKALMMHAWGKEVEFLPSLEGDEIVPIAYSSSALTKQEMTSLIEWILAWAAQNGVKLKGDGVDGVE